MRMRADNQIDSVLNQPSRELALSLGHKRGVFLAPMDERDQRLCLFARALNRLPQTRTIARGRNRGCRCVGIVEREERDASAAWKSDDMRGKGLLGCCPRTD